MGRQELQLGRRQELSRQLPPALLLGLAVAIACLAGILTRPTGLLATIWPANALMFGLLIRFPRTNTPLGWLFAAGAYLLADLLTGSGLARALLLNSANLVGVAAGMLVCVRLPGNIQRLRDPMSMLYLVLVSAVAATAAGGVGMVANPLLFGGDPIEGLQFWFATELVNYIAFLPVILAFPALSRHLLTRSVRPLDFAPFLALVGLCGLAIAVGGGGAIAFPVPALFWCALVYTPFTTALLTLAFGVWTLLTISAGYLPVYGDPNDPFSLISVRLGVSLMSIAPQMIASVMGSRNELLVRLRTMANEDGLTSILNRSGFLGLARERLQSSATSGAVVMFDIDHFKAINDRFGHAAGDEVLVALSRRVGSLLRSGDVFGRLGGEEFAVVAAPCTRDEAAILSERLRSSIDSAPIILPDGVLVSVTISIGYAFGISDPDQLERYLAAADKALYRAKANGRNRVVAAIEYQPEPMPTSVVKFGSSHTAA